MGLLSKSSFAIATRTTAGSLRALGSVLPEACSRLYELTRSRRDDEAKALQQQLLPAARLLGSLYGVAALKAALALVGCDVGRPRPPLLPLDDVQIAELASALSVFDEARGHVAS